ncbi:hypothetical protein PHYSODRAFT_435929, partial [Phytophthora sojae]
FYSEVASSERAAAFWRSFEKCTEGMDDALRLTAFEQCMKGKVGQEWWYNSRIENFTTLKIRFHNRFVSRTPAQMWSQLRPARRNYGESVEEWGDRVNRMCEALRYNGPRMRYEFFVEGLRNKQLRAMLNASVVSTIEEAGTLLLFKGLHRPVEEEDEFAESEKTSGETGGGGSERQLHIRMAPDTHTQEGETVCGRCERRNCSRLTYARGKGTCNRYGEFGHFFMECYLP